MKLSTSRFGEIEVDPKLVVTFAHGIPGFDELKEFLLVEPDPDVLFMFLQSVEEGDVSFIMTNPFLFFPDYAFTLSDAVKEELNIRTESDCAVWSIVSVKESILDATLNLLAPVIINTAERRGKQIILTGSSYRTKHALPLTNVSEEGKEESSDAGSVTQER